MSVLLITVLAMLSAGGLAFALLLPRISTEETADRRLRSIRERKAAKPAQRGEASLRRARVQEVLKEIEEKSKRGTQKPPLKSQLQQAGLTWSVQRFFVVGASFGFGLVVVLLMLGMGLAPAAAAGVVAGLGAPRWLIGFLRKRRQARFIDEFPNAIDIIVRGLKAGLPLNDCLRIIAQEAKEPVKSEFRQIVEAQALGVPISDAVTRLQERVAVAEANFFAIALGIQQKTGGNLAETLSNLSKVLRDRKKLKGKIRAMSQEAKSSAWIIGALPILVMLFVYLSTPDYIALLWTTTLGHLMLVGSALWMLCGVLVMRKMINFDF